MSATNTPYEQTDTVDDWKTQKSISKHLGGDLRRERLHRLLVEVMHGDLWDNPDATNYGWCGFDNKIEGIFRFYPQAMEEGWWGGELDKGITDYFALHSRCRFCKRQNHCCPTEWGFLTDNSSSLEETPTILLSPYESAGANYNAHYNVIVMDIEWAQFCPEDILNHEMIHYVLDKLFPRRDVSERFDNIVQKLEEWEDSGYQQIESKNTQ